MKQTPPNPYNLAKRLHRLGDLLVEAVEVRGKQVPQCSEALRLAHDWQIPLSSPAGPGPKGTISDPTGNVAARRARKKGDRRKAKADDFLATIYPRLVAALNKVEDGAAEVDGLIDIVMRRPLDPDKAKEAQRGAGSGQCLACGHWASGTRETGDRIIAGFCHACANAWYRAGQPNRSDFIRRRQEKANDEQAT